MPICLFNYLWLPLHLECSDAVVTTETVGHTKLKILAIWPFIIMGSHAGHSVQK